MILRSCVHCRYPPGDQPCVRISGAAEKHDPDERYQPGGIAEGACRRYTRDHTAEGQTIGQPSFIVGPVA